MLLSYMLLPVLLLNSINCYVGSEDELLAVSLIYRHGDRTPRMFYPTDPHKNSPEWPAAPGELTNVGKLQLYLLGKWLRNRYDGFLSQNYNRSEIYVRSSDVDRCIMSAALKLAGLYPPQGKDVWKEDISWQAIPIHTIPIEEDDIAEVFNSCPKYSKILKEAQELPYFKNLQEEHESFYELLTNKTGKKIANIIDAFHLFDILQIETKYNFSLPNWTHEVYPKLKNLHDISPKLLTSTPELTKLFVGRLFKNILLQFDKFSGRNSSSLVSSKTKKFMAYSVHDDQVFSVLNALKVPNLKPASYASSVIFELRKSSKGELLVQAFHRTNSSGIDSINIQGCEMECKLDEFNDILQPITLTKEEYKNQCVNIV